MENKTGILVLTSSYPTRKGDINGGFVHELSRRLADDFHVVVLAPWSRGLSRYETIDNVTVYRHRQFFWQLELAYGIGLYENLKKNRLKYFILPFYFLFQLVSMTRVIKRERIRMIHAHWLIPNGFIAVLYKKLFKKEIKILATIHGSDFLGVNNIIGNRFKRFTLKNIDELSVVSNALKNEVKESGYKKSIHVFPMGVDTGEFSPTKKDISLKEKLNIFGEFLLFVGMVIEAKGVRLLIEALPEILTEFPGARLVVIGEGDVKTEMIRLTSQLKITDNVIFTGALPHEELPPYFATADLFILPSFSEGFGLVIIEAMSCKTLAVTSNLEVIHDIITENETGFFFEAINKVAISEKIIFVLKNKEKFENIREKGRQHIIEKFDWNIVSNNYSILLNKLII